MGFRSQQLVRSVTASVGSRRQTGYPQARKVLPAPTGDLLIMLNAMTDIDIELLERIIRPIVEGQS
jgi:hypothetical protein